jgi:hypothetical protein
MSPTPKFRAEAEQEVRNWVRIPVAVILVDSDLSKRSQEYHTYPSLDTVSGHSRPESRVPW